MQHALGCQRAFSNSQISYAGYCREEKVKSNTALHPDTYLYTISLDWGRGEPEANPGDVPTPFNASR